jgi:Na+/proline symporter
MQSSADVVLLSASAVTARDLVPPLTGRPLPLAVARALTPLFGMLGLLVALAMGRDVLETLRLGYSIFAAGLILPVLVALLPGWPLVPRWGAIAAMIAGGATAAAGRLNPNLGSLGDPVLLGTGVNLAILLVTAVLGRLARASSPIMPTR